MDGSITLQSIILWNLTFDSNILPTYKDNRNVSQLIINKIICEICILKYLQVMDFEPLRSTFQIWL